MRARKMRAIEMCAREMREGDACESEANASAQPVLSLALFADHRAKDRYLQPSLASISSRSSFTLSRFHFSRSRSLRSQALPRAVVRSRVPRPQGLE